MMVMGSWLRRLDVDRFFGALSLNKDVVDPAIDFVVLKSDIEGDGFARLLYPLSDGFDETITLFAVPNVRGGFVETGVTERVDPAGFGFRVLVDFPGSF